MASRGFTLIELLITVSVASILLSVAAPSYREFVQDSRLLTQSSGFHSAMMLTKNEAIKSNSPATICPSTDDATCTGGTTWSDGWLIFADTDGDGAVDAGEQIIRVGAPLVGGNTLMSGASRLWVTFAANGFTLGFNGTFSLCDNRGAAMSRRLILNNQGRLRTETGGGTCPS